MTRLIRSKEEFSKWICEMQAEAICVSSEDEYPPDQYPCVISWQTTNADSMTYAEWCQSDYIYLSDFEG